MLRSCALSRGSARSPHRARLSAAVTGSSSCICRINSLLIMNGARSPAAGRERSSTGRGCSTGVTKEGEWAIASRQPLTGVGNWSTKPDVSCCSD